jgi:hypothetical protein
MNNVISLRRLYLVGYSFVDKNGATGSGRGYVETDILISQESRLLVIELILAECQSLKETVVISFQQVPSTFAKNLKPFFISLRKGN